MVHVVVFHSARMKRLFRDFPDVVLVDTTHGTNTNKYKLFSFAVTDLFGKTSHKIMDVFCVGQYVMHALVKAETKENLRLAVDCFEHWNPPWTKIKLFITDKAFHGNDVLLEMFPEHPQLLCTFHVVTWLEQQAGRLSAGTTEAKDKLKTAMSLLASSTSEKQYEQVKAYLLKRLDGNQQHDLNQFCWTIGTEAETSGLYIYRLSWQKQNLRRRTSV
ncbi:hypothetical protein JG687_00016492 [Phytophthora cactorum]|uniref:ZSWIM1/3 RNaseH-like domain-containing protein n=1 Tax=Phytophthora cactorum TaxID=29920 RepID=A0A8T1TS35_9STRA|nr:hypothetical protein JG687_00016492 [Phytophthora cactorum]